MKNFRVRGFVLHRHPHIREGHPAMGEGNKGVSRELIVEDVQAENEEDAIEKVRALCAKKYNLVTETGTKWYNVEGNEVGYKFEVEK